MNQHIQRALPVAAVLVAMPLLAAPQSLCFESQSSLIAAGTTRTAATADFDGDGHLDVVMSTGGAVQIAYGSGDGAFAAPVPIAPGIAERLLVGDFDGDGLPDVVWDRGIFWNQGNGTFLAATIDALLGIQPASLSIGDIDQNGYPDLVGVEVLSPWSSVGRALLSDGSRGFWWTFISLNYHADAGTALADIDGDGDLDFLVAHTSSQLVLAYRNNGQGGFGQPIHLNAASSPTSVVGAQFDGHPALDVAAIDLGSKTVAIWRGQGGGTYAPRSDVSYGGGVAFALSFADLDADGDLDLIAAIWAPGPPATGRLVHFLNDGSGTFTPATTLSNALPFVDVFSADVDRDGDLDLVTVASVTGTSNTVEVRRACGIAGRVSCAGDGSASACPCANSSPSGSQRGCLNSNGTGAGLRASGSLLLTDDTCVLEADGMPSSTTVFFFQGNTAANGGQGRPFGDGLSCATGSLRRIAVKSATSGSARYPESGEAALSVRGQVLGAGTRTYQVLYRDPAASCTSADFNLSNGIVVTWI